MKELFKVFAKDIESEQFTKREVIIFAVVVPLVFIFLCILADTIINKQQY